MMRYCLIVFACVALLSCSGDTRPSDVLSPEKMQPVLWDFIRADAFTTDYISRDSSKKPEVENVKMQKQIFAKYKISKETFYKSYQYYEDHPEEMGVMLDSMITRQRRMSVNAVPAPLQLETVNVTDTSKKLKMDTLPVSVDGFRTNRNRFSSPKIDSLKKKNTLHKNFLKNKKQRPALNTQ